MLFNRMVGRAHKIKTGRHRNAAPYKFSIHVTLHDVVGYRRPIATPNNESDNPFGQEPLGTDAVLLHLKVIAVSAESVGRWCMH